MGLFKRPKKMLDSIAVEMEVPKEKKSSKKDKDYDSKPDEISVKKAYEGYIICVRWTDGMYEQKEAAVERSEDVIAKVKDFLDIAEED